MENNKQVQTRKQYVKKGKCTSKMMSYRCDGDNLSRLRSVMNKGKLINDLLREYFSRLPNEPMDYPPDENLIEDMEV